MCSVSYPPAVVSFASRSRFCSRIRLLVLAIFVVNIVGEVAGDSCPGVCSCKWKSGKKSVECSDKNLITIPEGIDPETQLLDMSGNNLQTLPRETFVRAALLDLQKVYLRDCQIGQIDDRALQGLSNVVDLDLSRNLLTSIPSSIFEDVPNLRNLSLAHNPIQKIDATAFRNASELTKLDLSHCRIAIIATRAFDGIENMELLRLNGNKLSELRLGTVDTLASLHGIELHDNPWYCDCGLRALKLWLTEKNIPYPIEPVCYSGPSRVANKPFNQLHADDFACKPEMKIKPDHRYVESAVGDNATVVCRVDSIPRATISWYWNGRLLLNNTAFSSFQRIFIYESGETTATECKSLLTLTNAQESDSSQFYCVAENNAGAADANFTLRVVHRLVGFPFLGGSAQTTMLSAVLIVVIFLILASIAYLLLCIRKMPPNTRHLKHGATAADGHVDQHLANGGLHGHHQTDSKSILVEPTLDSSRKFYASGLDGSGNGNDAAYTAAQTLPRLNGGISYTTVFEDQLLEGTRRNVYHKQQETSNPDLIADASQKAGEYTRSTTGYHHDLFYPSSLWNQNDLPQIYAATAAAGSTGSSSVAADVTSTCGNASILVGSDYRDTNDKTPIIEEVSFYESQQSQHHQHHHHHQQQRHQPQSSYHHQQPPPLPRRSKDCEFGATSTAVEAASATTSINATSSSPVESQNLTTTTTTTSASSNLSPFGGHPNAKTIRVWQKGVQVLPPVTALKRVLNRNSPDEGYQEGCGTDV